MKLSQRGKLTFEIFMIRMVLLVGLIIGTQTLADAPNATVALNGTGDYTSVQAALDAVPQVIRDDGHRWVILVKQGVHTESIRVPLKKQFISLVGENEEKTVLAYGLFASSLGPDGKPVGTFQTASLIVDASNFSLENLTVANTAGPKGQAVSLRLDGDRICIRHCHLKGWQDTLLVNRGRHYFEDCTIDGAVDFVFGAGTDWFEKCHIYASGNGYLTAASTPDNQAFGYVFNHCDVSSAENVRTYLGRPWRDYAQVVYLHTEMSAAVRPEGWQNWNKPQTEKTANYAEFDSTGPGAPNGKRVAWAKQLSAVQAERYTVGNVMGGSDHWDPTVKATTRP